MCKIFKYCSPKLYADDLALTCSADNFNELESKINYDLCNLSDWCRFSRQLINKVKTKYMVFSSTFPTPIALRLDGIPLEQVSNFKYLGVILDRKLKFADHVDMLVSKLSQLNGVLYRVASKFDFHGAMLFYSAFVYSILNFGIEVW